MLHGRFHCFGAGIAKDNTVVPLCPTRQLPRSVALRICGPIPVRGSAFIQEEPLLPLQSRDESAQQQRSVAADEVKYSNFAALLVMVVKKVAFTAVINDIESDRPE